MGTSSLTKAWIENTPLWMIKRLNYIFESFYNGSTVYKIRLVIFEIEYTAKGIEGDELASEHKMKRSNLMSDY